TGFTLVNKEGKILIDGEYVPSSLYDFAPHHVWINNRYFLLTEWDNGFDTLILIDAVTLQRQKLANPIARFALSSDDQWLALEPYVTSPSGSELSDMRFYHWTGKSYQVEYSASPPDFIRTMLWIPGNDGLELTALFRDQSLQVYDQETATWRLITTLPEDNWWVMDSTPCRE
ncbi:MAG TPA: hypothetical protein VHL11_04625, partial [Phototrophicaceae bacterium]|nr:hypothetical protein [Phototrophicaceae bacterium]